MPIVASTSPASTSSPTATFDRRHGAAGAERGGHLVDPFDRPGQRDRLGHRRRGHGGGAEPGRGGLAGQRVDDEVGGGAEDGRRRSRARSSAPSGEERVGQPPRTPGVHEPSVGWLRARVVAVSVPVSSVLAGRADAGPHGDRRGRDLLRREEGRVAVVGHLCRRARGGCRRAGRRRPAARAAPGMVRVRVNDPEDVAVTSPTAPRPPKPRPPGGPPDGLPDGMSEGAPDGIPDGGVPPPGKPPAGSRTTGTGNAVAATASTGWSPWWLPACRCRRSRRWGSSTRSKCRMPCAR